MHIPVLLLAHAFGGSYVLPLPIWLYLYAAAAAVVLSFLAVAILDRSLPDQAATSHRVWTFPRWLVSLATWAGLALAALVVAAGLWGSPLPLANISITIFWIGILLGFTYLSVLVGGVWPLINPVATLYRWISPYVPQPEQYPDRLSYWPALVLYGGLIWLELLSHGFATVPFNLAGILLVYGLVMMAGQVVYGPVWLHRADLFTVFFAQVGRLAPIVVSDGGVHARKWLSGLVGQLVPMSLVVFIIAMLASTAFDGFRETTAFGQVYNFIIAEIPGMAAVSPDIIQVLVLLGTLAAFLGVYLLCLFAMKTLADLPQSVWVLAAKFATSLIPIAVAYNMAHYYTLLVTQGQAVIAQISDPFGVGWNIFGTAHYRINIGLLPAPFVWYSQVALILAGHIIAIIVAHRSALLLAHNPRQAVLSQYPLLLLMVIYTVTSLWIIAQPFALVM